MMNDLLTKISISIQDIHSEAEVVYILTRIGKILELEGAKYTHQTLNFYRNWCVHAFLDDKVAVPKYLTAFIEGRQDIQSLLSHSSLLAELESFLKEHELNQLSKSNQERFIYYLRLVISDTPLKMTVAGPTYEFITSSPSNKEEQGKYDLKVTAKVAPVAIDIQIHKAIAQSA